jgi:hypothetical protein
MSGKFGTTEVQEVVHAAVVVESSVIQVKNILTGGGGLLAKAKILGVAVTLLTGVAPLVSLDLNEFKNELLDLDATDDADVVAALKSALQDAGQSTDIVDPIATALSLVERTYAMVQEWITDVKRWFHLS